MITRDRGTINDYDDEESYLTVTNPERFASYSESDQHLLVTGAALVAHGLIRDAKTVEEALEQVDYLKNVCI